jgi:hypothetical protein
MDVVETLAAVVPPNGMKAGDNSNDLRFHLWLEFCNVYFKQKKLPQLWHVWVTPGSPQFENRQLLESLRKFN